MYILRKGDKVYKPVSLKTMRTWVYENRVSMVDMVSSDGGKTWTRAGKIPELLPFFPASSKFQTETTRGYSGKVERRRKSIEVIDMIPMIDMVFLLLIFFALTSTFEIQRVLEMSLPEAASGRELKEKKTVTIYIRKERPALFNNQPIQLDNLKTELKTAAAENSRLTLIIRGDSQTPHGRVVEVMDIANASGVDKILITVRKQG